MKDAPLTLDPCFGKLGRDIERFANRTRRLVGASTRYRAELIRASEWSEGRAPLSSAPESPLLALRAVEDFARSIRANPGERASLMGAYFAHHHLRAQAELSRELLRQSFAGHRLESCRQAYARAEFDRRAWVSALLDRLIHTSAPELSTEDYAAFNVGALTDHEDVDLALVAASAAVRETLTHAFAAVSKTFLRFASKIQLFLTEQFETPRSAALIEEYERFFGDSGQKVVSATQLLGAQHIAGSPRLARALEERVALRFYAARGSPLVHEAYLRSVMSELRHHLALEGVPGVLAPKREVYVPAKLAVAAMRVIHGVRDPRPPQALEALRAKDPAHAEALGALADAFVENEVLRALMFLYVMQSDELDLADPSIRQSSRRVAILLGLGASARRSAEARLVGMYMDLRARALRAVGSLSAAIAQHLGTVSTFRRLVAHAKDLSGPGENLVLALGSALESHKGGVFWDEVVELFGSTPLLAERFVADFERLEASARRTTAKRYVRMMCEDAASLVDLLVLLTVAEADAPPPEDAPRSPEVFFGAMLEVLAEDPSARQSFIQRLDTETRAEALHRLATAYPVAALAALADLIDGDDHAQSTRVARALRSAIILVHHTSNAFGRIAARVLGRAPEFVQRLSDARRLKELAAELNVRASREPVAREQLEILGDAFDVSSLRAALLAVLDGHPVARDAEYTQAIDQYVRELFKLCFREVVTRSSLFSTYRPGSGIAVYVTGGFGRGEAFGADWDYIAVIEHDDGALKKFFGKVLQRVSGAMARRGLMPHNRFTDRFNAYVVSLPELEGHLRDRQETTFIDEAEVLEARLLLGDASVARRFGERIFELVLSTHGTLFVRDILREIRDRRARPPGGLDLKLSPGGLREIHLLFLAVRVAAALPGPLVPALLESAEQVFPSHRADLRFLLAAHDELRRARELYRLIVASDDVMEPERIVAVAKDLTPLRRAGIRPDYGERIASLMKRVARRIDRVARTIDARLQGA